MRRTRPHRGCTCPSCEFFAELEAEDCLEFCEEAEPPASVQEEETIQGWMERIERYLLVNWDFFEEFDAF